MKKFIILLLLLIFLDFIWLNYFVKKHWSNMITKIQIDRLAINKIYLLPVYILMTMSILFFCLPNIKNKNIILSSIKWSGALGFIIYGIFNLTNLIIFKNYNIFIAISDTIWGIFLYSISTILLKYTLNLLKNII